MDRISETTISADLSLSDILSILNEAQHTAKIGSWNWNIITGKVWWSDELYNIFEVDPDQYIPTFESNEKFVHPEDSEDYHKAALDSLKTGKNLDYKLRIIAGDKIKHCRSLANVHFDDEGKALRMCGTFMDITEQVRIMNELNAAREKAEESDRLKTAFLQNISHEVRTPLNSIVGFAELLSEPGQSLQKMNSYSKIISVNSQKLIRIISDVIEISQIHSNQTRLVLSNFDVVGSLYRIANGFMEITQLKEVELLIEQNIPEDKSVIQSDKGKIEKIFFHLIDNAVKFTQKGTIRIIISLAGDNLNFEISDTGIGIPEDKQKLIFDPFRQIETGLNRNFGGTGLGLTIIKAYIDSLKGNILLSSEVNKGTRIELVLPVKTGFDERKNIRKDQDHDSVDTILIAEDEYSNFKYLYEVLHSDNLEILHANNGREAVEICKKSDDIKMILMDLKMPVMDGTSAAKQIKEFRPGLPIIAQTAYVPEDEKMNSVFDDLIAKPINRNDLKQKMSKYINV
ncbi:MAG TPA: ATP-binding protein [Bacteroidales bacterium]|nr:ATP-binding protein [Bacteroidales bacterium]